MNFYRRILGKLSQSLILMLFFQKLGWNQLQVQMFLQVSKVVEFIHSITMFFKICKHQKAVLPSVPVRSSLQSIETSPADKSDTRLIIKMGSVTDNSSLSAAQEELYQRGVEDGCDLFIDLYYIC